MRRLIAVLLLALVSLQSSWAVAAAYCGHETSRDAAHFGHHVDGHVTVPGDGQGDGRGYGHERGVRHADGQADADSLGATVDAAEHGDTDDGGAPSGGHCHDCHASPIGVILPLAQTSVYLSSSAVAAPPLRRLPTPPSQPLERPDWQSLA